MGTNYYLERDVCGCCGRAKDRLHIGKSSGGWCFALNTHPDERILSLEDWRYAWAQPGCRIRDEYGDEITASDMEQHITNRSWGGRELEPAEMERNSAMSGPNGLLRHRVDGRHCIANGEGTWDLMCGEFG